MLMKGSDIIVECLLEQGVDTVFGYPGGAVLDIYDSLYKYSDKLSHVLTAHEQGASHAADGYARATGKTGVVIATSGPGATNLVTGIATAYMDSIPMVAITGNVSCSLLGLDSFQEVDITGITLPITKHNFIVKDTAKLADTIRLAFRIAESGRKGPVLIDIPKDITQKSAEYERKEKAPAFKTPAADEKDVREAVEMLANAKRPYIYTGGGIISADACSELAEFAELLDAPVSSSLMGQGCFDQTNPRYIGMLGMHGTKAAAETIKNCDLFIALGTRFSDRVTGNTKTFASDAKILQIDIDSAEMGKNVEAHKVVVGDVKEVLGRINKLLPKQNHAEWTANSERMAKELTVTMKGTEALPVTPDYLIETLDRLTEGNAVIATEVGQNQMWAAQYYKYRNPRSFISSGGLGTMGYGLGAAMGAKVGCPDKVVVNIAGDGSFHMNLNELVTASKNNIRIIELVINNDVLGMVRQWQRLFYSEHYSQTTLERPTDYVKLGEAFGIKALVIEKTEDVERVLKEALEESKTRPVLVECRIDKDINVLPMVPAGKSITEPIMEIEI